MHLFHMASVSDRESIAKLGLLPRHPDGHSGAEQWGNPTGVYLYEMEQLERRRSDLGRSYETWIVDARDLLLLEDLTVDGAWYVAADARVEPERLSRYVPGAGGAVPRQWRPRLTA